MRKRNDIDRAMTPSNVLEKGMTARQVVQQTVDIFKSLGHSILYSYLLAHEDSGRVDKLSKEQKSYLSKVRAKLHCKAQQCYKNAQRLCERDQEHRILYHEGVVVMPEFPVPIDHAWNTLDGIIVDLTEVANRQRARRRGYAENEPLSYCGVRVPLDEVRKAQWATERHCAVLEEDITGRVFGWMENQTGGKKWRGTGRQ